MDAGVRTCDRAYAHPRRNRAGLELLGVGPETPCLSTPCTRSGRRTRSGSTRRSRARRLRYYRIRQRSRRGKLGAKQCLPELLLGSCRKSTHRQSGVALRLWLPRSQESTAWGAWGERVPAAMSRRPGHAPCRARAGHETDPPRSRDTRASASGRHRQLWGVTTVNDKAGGSSILWPDPGAPLVEAVRPTVEQAEWMAEALGPKPGALKAARPVGYRDHRDRVRRTRPPGHDPDRRQGRQQARCLRNPDRCERHCRSCTGALSHPRGIPPLGKAVGLDVSPGAHPRVEATMSPGQTTTPHPPSAPDERPLSSF
jgi:hypothetical protein